MTEQPPKPSSRAGLAKLRGDSSPPPQVAQAAPAPAEVVVEERPAALVTLTKSDPQVPAGVPKRPGSRLAAAIVALVAAVAVLLTLVLINPFDSGAKPSAAGAATGSGGSSDVRLAVVRAARQFAVSFFTYDYRKIDAYFRRIEAASAGDFRKDFVSKEATLKTVVTQLKTVAAGQVPDAGAGLSQLNGDKAVALIAANFNASNAVTKNGQKRYRVTIALQRVKGTWLVTNFDQVV